MSRLSGSLVLLAFVVLVDVALSAPSAPHVIVILADDLGAADAGFNARLLRSDNETKTAIATPALDALAARGVVSARFYTHGQCAPSRSALLTGRSAHTTGNIFPQLTGAASLDPGLTTIAQVLRGRGYRTHFVGKWGVDSPSNPNATGNMSLPFPPGLGPIARGFDTYYGNYFHAHNHFTKELLLPGNYDLHRLTAASEAHVPAIPNEPDVHSTNLYTREAVQVIEGWAADGPPGFLHLSYTAPHDPLLCPQHYVEGSESCRAMPNWRRRQYCGLVAGLDEGVGNITRALEARGLLGRTIIFFSSDNGGTAFSGGFNYPLRGQKSTLYEGGLRVPSFIVAPGLAGGQVYRGLMHMSDVAPTIVGLVDSATGGAPAGAPGFGADIDGLDQSGALGGDVPCPRGSVVGEFHPVYNGAAFITDRYKLLVGYTGPERKFAEPPASGWMDAEERWDVKVEEVLQDALEHSMGLLSFPAKFLVHNLANAWREEWGLLRFGTWRPNQTLWALPPDYRIPLQDTRLGQNDWLAEGSELEVQLYDLLEDPAEDRDLALEGDTWRPLIAEMSAELWELVKNDPPTHLGPYKGYTQPVQGVRFLMFVSMVMSMFYCCCCRRRRKHGRAGSKLKDQ